MTSEPTETQPFPAEAIPVLPPGDDTTFGELLRRWRVAAELTQEELAEQAGISVRTVSDLERGLNRTPRKDTLQLLVQALRLSPQERAAIEVIARRTRRSHRLTEHTDVSSPVETRPNCTPVVQGLPTQGVPADRVAGADRGGEELETAPGLYIALLGGFSVRVGPRVVTADAWRLRKAGSLVKLLALAPQHRLQREQIMDRLWPDLEPRSAANSLHQVLHAARRILDPDAPLAARYLHLQGDVLSLSIQHPVWVDVEAFEATAAAARRSEDLAVYRAALDLYTGDLLPDDLYEDWVGDRRERLRQERLLLLRGLAQLYEDRREYAAAIDVLRATLAVDTAHEEAHAALMRLYACTGQRQHALRQYQVLEGALRRELDVAPHPDTQRLYRDIAAGHLLPSNQYRTPARVLPADDATTSSASGDGPNAWDASRADAATYPTNLPLPVNRFVGRVREQAEVKRLLARTRLLTLTGTGGCGKTRLALQVAADLQQELPDGAWLVELAAVGQPGLVPQEVAAAMGVLEQPGQPVVQALVTHLQRKRLLLLLDNCEHLVAACAALAETLVRACPHLRILSTSREPLHVAGEITWQVRSLALPDPHRLPPLADVVQYDAVQLFTDRAQAVVPAFAVTPDNVSTVAQICYRLDGLPLALELAAARVKALSLEQIVTRLDDCFRLLATGARTALSRQQTLKATLDWSYELLARPEQALFRRLAVFAGSFDLDAAEAIGARGAIDASDILDLLMQLVDKSLVLADDDGDTVRYRLLEPVRQYARRLLDTSDEAEPVRRRHRDWYLGVAAQANAAFWTADQRSWLRPLEREADNLRAALDWCVTARGEVEAGLRLAGALWQFWLLRGYYTEGRRWLDRLLATAPARTPVRGAVLLHACALAARQGDLATAASCAEQGAALYQALHDIRGHVRAIHLRSVVAWLQFDYRQATAVLEEGLALARAVGLDAECAVLTHSLGVTTWSQGDYRRARTLMEASLDRLRALGNAPQVTSSFLTVGLMARGGTAYERASVVLEETLLLLREMGANVAIGYALANLGNVARAEGQHQRSAGLLAESLAVFQELGDKAGKGQVVGQLGNLALAVGDYGQARILLEESLALRQELGDRRGIGRTLANLGNLAIAEGDDTRARALYDESMALFQTTGDKPGIAWLLLNMGHLAVRDGAYDRARALFEEVYTRFAEIGHARRGMALSRLHLGIVARLDSDLVTARSYFEECLLLYREVGDRRSVAALLHNLGEVALAMEDRAVARARFEESLGHARDLGDEDGIGLALDGLARITPSPDAALRPI